MTWIYRTAVLLTPGGAAFVISLLAYTALVPAAGTALAQEFALDQLEASPRHHEWVEVAAGDDRTVHAFVAYPETNEPVPGVIVIHENRGLTDWVRSFADQIAAEGYVAIAPDLLSEFDEAHARTAAFETSDAARDAIYQLEAEQVTSDLSAVQDYVSTLPATTDDIVVMGFCWGGSQTFRFATQSPDIAAAFVFYGSPPETGFADIEAPVYGFYGENDERINATIPETQERMAEHSKVYDVVIYEGAGHAFMRQGDDPEGSPESKAARDEAWERVREILDRYGS